MSFCTKKVAKVPLSFTPGFSLNESLQFCHERGFKSVFLWTVSELTIAAHLYRDAGFQRTESKTHEIWGKLRTEERYDLFLTKI